MTLFKPALNSFYGMFGVYLKTHISSVSLFLHLSVVVSTGIKLSAFMAVGGELQVEMPGKGWVLL